MADFDPGEGWREVRTPPFEGEADYLTLTTADDTDDRYWVKERPVPPLPTEPHTVIRVSWKPGKPYVDSVLRLREAGDWGLNALTFAAENLLSLITGWETLARPIGMVLAKDEDAYYDSDDVEKARREGFDEALGNVRLYATGRPWLKHVCKTIADRGPHARDSD